MAPVATKEPRRRPSQERKFVHEPLTPFWEGETCVLVSGGPSLSIGQIHTAKIAWVEGRTKVIGVNDAYRIAPWINGLYAADIRWWDHHIEEVRKTHIPLLWSQHDKACKQYGLWFTPGHSQNPHGPGLSLDPNYIRFGHNSGFQAFNIAVLLGCKRIILLGYDYTMGEAGERHWFGNHPSPMNKAPDYDSWAKCYNSTVDILDDIGCEVINCSPRSIIDCFPKSTIGKVLG